jgi:nicotinate phosphoribosyltransferase
VAVPGGLETDLYELTMAASYLRHEMDAEATFSLFVRRLPPERGFLVAAGVERAVDFLEGFGFEEADLSYLSALGFDPKIVAALGQLRFTGDVDAIPEGRIVLANEPILEVSAPIAQAQLVETALLNIVSTETLLASKAARCKIAAAGQIELVEFGFRRSQGLEAGIAAARLAAIVGFAATSNVEAARRFGIRPAGTMAHSYIEAFETERDAFATFAGDHPEGTILLVDTYDTMTGVERAIEVMKEKGIEATSGIRLDSGDLEQLAFLARRRLDDAGLVNAKIFASGGLDEHDVARFVASKAPIDAVGIGTKLTTSADAPYLDSAYKLVSYAGRPVAKLSKGKATLPGPKQVFRGPGLRDTIACRDEEAHSGETGLLEPVLRAGRRVTAPSTIEEARRRFEEDLAELPSDARLLERPVAPVAAVSARLARLAREVHEAARRR